MTVTSPATVDEAIAKTRHEFDREGEATQRFMAEREPTHRRLERVAAHLWCTAQRHPDAAHGLACDACVLEVRRAVTHPQPST